MENDLEFQRNRIQISAIVIAVYTTLIFSIPNIFPYATSENDLFTYLVYNLFVGAGIFIDFFFFMYISFFALELKLGDKWPREIWAGVELDKGQVKRIQQFFYNIGVNFIFFSFFGLVAGIPNMLIKFAHLKTSTAWLVGGAIILIILALIQIAIVRTRTKDRTLM